jgi:hypothetical protein
MTQAITSTGLQGFLAWLKQDQPNVYAAVAAKIQQAVPRGFSGFNGSVAKGIRLAQGRRSMRLRGYGGLGSCCAPAMSMVGICSALQTPQVCIETTCAANTGTTCNSTLTGVANIISATAGAVLGQEQLDTYNNIVGQQLQRASTGLYPLQISSRAAGLPLISGLGSSLSGSSGLLWLLGGGLLLWAVARK